MPSAPATTAEPAFSISVPIKTGLKYLETTLSSLALQGGLAEVALLDASGDSSVRTLAERYAPMIAYRYHRSRDGGQSAAIQEGWDNTAAPFVGWLNADDFLLPGALARAKAAFDADPEVDVVYGHAVYVDEHGAFQQYFPSISEDIAAITRGNLICQPACFVRRTAMQRVGGLDLALHYAMDWDLWIRLYKAGCRFRFLQDPLAVVHDHRDTKTRTGGSARLREINRCLRSHPTWLERARSSLSFRLYDYLYQGESPPLGRRLHGLVSALRHRNRPYLFGLQCLSNRVEERCTITLPWFDRSAPTHLVMMTDREGRYRVRDGAGWHALTPASAHPVRAAGPEEKAFVYTAPISMTPANRYDIAVESADGPWRLLSLRLQHRDNGAVRQG